MWPEQGVCDFSNAFLLQKFVIQISLNYDPEFPTDDKSALTQVMDRRLLDVCYKEVYLTTDNIL